MRRQDKVWLTLRLEWTYLSTNTEINGFNQDYANLFPDYMASMQAQQMLAKERKKVIPAEDWKEIMVSLSP